MKQNNAFKNLMTGSNIGLVLAARHRDLCWYPKLLESKMLYDITFPPGILAGGNRPFNRNLKHKSCSLYQPQAITVKEDAVESITSTSSKLSKKYTTKTRNFSIKISRLLAELVYFVVFHHR